MNKYGLDSVEIFVLEEGVEGDYTLLEDLERKWIKHFKDLGSDLLNCDDGGRGGRGRKRSPEAHAKWLKFREENPEKFLMSEEARRRTSERMKAENPVFKTPHSDGWKRRQSELMSGPDAPWRRNQRNLRGEDHPMHGRTGEKHPRYGTKHSEESKRKNSESQKAIPTIQCPHCPMTGKPSNMKRWHFDNCKKKEINASS
jgi:hypothetical protein